ncbi:hypothetical protein VP1G_10756 [Cytospora mali]|uniref:Uncharacterized protein n=1 Tax=Cytospora mali TaxID=578113 RepID=A0A194UV03_CYTMA|nr:hypothetical protein VP1G_10756 [Valsa mali var. pyri (nom. inval.)]
MCFDMDFVRNHGIIQKLVLLGIAPVFLAPAPELAVLAQNLTCSTCALACGLSTHVDLHGSKRKSSNWGLWNQDARRSESIALSIINHMAKEAKKPGCLVAKGPLSAPSPADE